MSMLRQAQSTGIGSNMLQLMAHLLESLLRCQASEDLYTQGITSPWTRMQSSNLVDSRLSWCCRELQQLIAAHD